MVDRATSFSGRANKVHVDTKSNAASDVIEGANRYLVEDRCVYFYTVKIFF